MINAVYVLAMLAFALVAVMIYYAIKDEYER